MQRNVKEQNELRPPETADIVMTDEEKSLAAMAIAYDMETIGLKCVIRDGDAGSFIWEEDEEDESGYLMEEGEEGYFEAMENGK